MTSWVLVRLYEPLGKRAADGSFSIATGRPELDAAIAETGVHRIDYALANAMRERRNPQALHRHGLDRTYRFHVPEGTEVTAAVRRFSRVPGVEYAEPDSIVRADWTEPNDPLFPDQWSLHQDSDCDVDAPEAWDITVGDAIAIAMLDSGVDPSHLDLDAKIDPGIDLVNGDYEPWDDNGHGTATSSIAAAETNDGEGMAGVCWNCRLVPVKILDADGNSTWSLFADGIVWATDHGTRLINLSGGGSVQNALLVSAVNYAYDAGVAFVASSGNYPDDPVRFPGICRETIAVGATDHLDNRYVNGSIGPEIDVVAPGVDVLTALLGGGHDTPTGTSLSAPHVAGLCGLLHTIDPSVGRDEARHLIRAGAEDQVGDPGDTTPGFDIYFGWGRINMHRTLEAAESSVSLRVEGREATRVYLEDTNTLATSYDFIRGDLAGLSEDWRGVDLGTVVCLEDDSPDADTAGDEDLETPDPGEAFFYLARFNAAPGPGSYGGSTRNRDRLVIPPSHAAWSAQCDQAGAQFGWSVSSAGDVNEDGYDDVIVGARWYDDTYTNEGRAYLYLGGPDGLADTPAWTADGDQADAEFGRQVAGAGDVNGDGYDDVIVGAYKYGNDQVGEGRAYVYLGTSSGLTVGPAWIAEGNQVDAGFGYSVASAGNVNGDDYDDVLVGAHRFDNGQTNEGRAYLYLGSATGLATVPAWTAEGEQAYAWLGATLGPAGNVNGDRYDDVIVGVPYFDGPEENEGRLLVFHGTATGLLTVPTTTLELDVEGSQLGAWSVGTAGDVNCDGFDDVIGTARLYSNSEYQEGLAVLYPGSPSGVSTTPVWSFEGGRSWAWLAQAGTAGHLNDDDCDDVIVGAQDYDSVRTDDGHAWVFYGSPSGLTTSPQWSTAGEQPVGKFGSVASAGDVNGDGYDDLIVGAYQHDNGEVDEGRVYVYLGSPSGPPPAASNGDCDSTQP